MAYSAYEWIEEAEEAIQDAQVQPAQVFALLAIARALYELRQALTEVLTE